MQNSDLAYSWLDGRSGLARLRTRLLGSCLLGLALVGLTGCPSSTLQPDLLPKQAFFDADNVLNVAFENQGDGAVPEGTGSLAIFIDGRAVGSYAFANLADQSFRDPGGSLTIRTNFRLAGTNRRIAVVVDPMDEIAESNEFQNTLTRTLTPPALTGPDFIVGDLSLASDSSLRIEVTNVGSASSPAALAVRVRVIVDESVAADLTPTLPALAPGASTTIAPATPIVVASNSDVRVLLNANNLFDEIDDTNNIREELLPNGPSLAPYTALLAEPKIRDNLLWRFGSGTPQPYASWGATRQGDLNAALLALERGERIGLAAPPALLANNTISASDAWSIYLAHVAVSLWVEVNNKVPWSLLDATNGELDILFNSVNMMAFFPSTNLYQFQGNRMGSITPWNPQVSFEFMSNLRLIRGSQLETINALADWMRGHLLHISAGDDLNDLYAYAGMPPADKVLYPLEGRRHISAGCWGTTGLWGAVLRAVNIPAKQSTIAFPNGDHSRPEFPSVDRSMPHGDDMYSAVLLPSGAVIPSASLMYTLADMNTKFLSPALDCEAGTCNTVGEQASYNSGKAQIEMAYTHMADFLLNLADDPALLDDHLRGPFVGGSVQEFVYPYFSDAERAAMAAALAARLTEIGDGDIAAGHSVVSARRSRFAQNK